MILINLIKVLAILSTDLVNAVYDPFEPFTRPAEIKDPSVSMADMEENFSADLPLFMRQDGLIQYNLSDPNDVGDQAVHQGLLIAALSLKRIKASYRVPNLDVLNAAGALNHLIVNGKLIRGIKPDGTVVDNASNDSLTGMILGLHFANKAGIDVSVQMRLIADELLENNYCLVNQDGTVTTYGALVDGVKTDPLRLTLALAVFSEARKICKDAKYAQAYDALYSKYGMLIPYPKVKLLWLEKTYDTHRAAIHLYILADNENDSKARKGLARIWRMTEKSGNPWIFFLVSSHCHIDGYTNARKLLSEFSVDDKEIVTEKIITDRPTFSWGGSELMTRQPIPPWKRGSQDFLWQRGLYSASNWVGRHDTKVSHSGVDFLLAYWGLK